MNDIGFGIKIKRSVILAHSVKNCRIRGDVGLPDNYGGIVRGFSGGIVKSYDWWYGGRNGSGSWGCGCIRRRCWGRYASAGCACGAPNPGEEGGCAAAIIFLQFIPLHARVGFEIWIIILHAGNGAGHFWNNPVIRIYAAVLRLRGWRWRN